MKLLPLLPDFPRPLIFAHRGWSRLAPENTMAAFRLARELGAPGVELDVHLTADGKVAVIHDHFTGRVEGKEPGTGLHLESATWSELSACEIGAWKDEKYRGERIPLLSELFEELGSELYFDVELKIKGHRDYGLEAATAAVIRAAGPKLSGRVIVSSFNPASLWRFKAVAPTVPTATLWHEDEELPWWLRRGQGRWISRSDALKPRGRDVTAALGARWKAGPRPFLPWTIDEAAEARRLLELGAVGIISNDPAALDLPLRAS